MTKKTYGLSDLQNYFSSQYNTEEGDSDCCKYVEYVDELYQKILGDSVVKIIDGMIKKSSKKHPADPVRVLVDDLKELMNNPLCTWNDDTKGECLSRYKKFVQITLGFFYANTWLTHGKHDDEFCVLIAENALFASEEIVKDVILGNYGTKEAKKAKATPGYNNPFASWDYMLHYRNNKVKKNTSDTNPDNSFVLKYPGANRYKVSDDNTCANQYIKKAVLLSFEKAHGIKVPGTSYLTFKDYEACHVWDKPTEREYYASIANLVLVPRALAQLTDHNESVKNLLRYRVFDIFNHFKPEGVPDPIKPQIYDRLKWRTL